MKLGSIFHPSDFSDASGIAFEHALRIALATQARLNMLHVGEDEDAEGRFPDARATLERWRMLPARSSAHAVAELGIEIREVVKSSDDPVAACLDFLEQHPAELIVLAVHQHEGRLRWTRERVGEPIARGAGEMTLFVPHEVAGFVSRDDGSVSLRNILVPIAIKPRGEPALEAAALMVQSLRLAEGTFHLLHVGSSPDEMPSIPFNTPPGWSVRKTVAGGEPAEVILQTADSVGADMIVMTTEGPQGFLDALRGSTSARVLRETRCPLMNLPANQWFSRVRRFWTG
jgi:nucleotide-binding universal stress UspA family protein